MVPSSRQRHHEPWSHSRLAVGALAAWANPNQMKGIQYQFNMFGDWDIVYPSYVWDIWYVWIYNPNQYSILFMFCQSYDEGYYIPIIITEINMGCKRVLYPHNHMMKDLYYHMILWCYGDIIYEGYLMGISFFLLSFNTNKDDEGWCYGDIHSYKLLYL